MLLIACAPKEEAAEPVAAATPQVASFTATEFAFAGPDSIAPGMTQIDFVNNGQQPHHMILVRINDGHTMQELNEFMAANPEATPSFITFYGAANVVGNGGRTGSTVDLPAGQYVAVCFVSDPADGKPHIDKGMLKTLVVAGERHEAPAPVAVAQITLSDFAFELPDLTAGTHTFQVVNNGPQPHEAQLVRLNDGVTVEQFLAAEQSGTTPPPGVALGGSGAISQGISNWWTVTLEPGNYVVICFVPDPADGVPHMVKGMVKTFTVS
jgi:hypothetical protein